MPMFTRDDAEAIAEKFHADVTPGRDHNLAVVRYQGKYVAQFGIRRASREKGHDYIPQQIFLSPRQCRQFRQCTLTLEGYIAILVEKRKFVRELRRVNDLKIARAGEYLDIECELSDEPDSEWARDFGAGPPGSRPLIIRASLTGRTVRVTADTGQPRESLTEAIDERIDHANRNAVKQSGGRHRQA